MVKPLRTTDIATFIKDFNKHFGKTFFLHGGCYIFARILQTQFGGTIYSNQDHCVLNKAGIFYDITGQVAQKYRRPYSIIDPLEALRYERYHNWNH